MAFRRTHRSSLRRSSVLPLCLALACGGSADGETSSEEGTEGSTEATTSPDTDATTGDATGGSTDATAGDDDTTTGDDETGGTTGTTPDGTPVFVAVGDAGWFASSCDGGQSWTHTQFSDEVGDHTPWTAFGGIAFGNDAFVAGFGWGAPGALLRSTDGFDWQTLPAEAFMGDEQDGYDSWTSGVVFTGSQFLALSQWPWASTDGSAWATANVELPPGSDQVRQLRAFPEQGLIVAALESQAGEGHPVGNFIAVSDDDGQSWFEGPGYDGACSGAIQHWGDIEMRGDTIVVATQDVCRSVDRGQTWEHIPAPLGGEVQDIFIDDAGFGAIVGTTVHHSTDGAAWAPLGDTAVPMRAAAWTEGAYAAVAPNGDAFAWSQDGQTWNAGALDWTPDGQTWVRDFAVGYVNIECDNSSP